MRVDQHGKPYNRTVVFVVMLIAAMSGGLMQTSLGTALPALMKAFDINLSTAQQATTWFLLMNGIMVTLSAYMANRFSTKKLHVVAYSLLTIGILMSMLTPEDSNYWWLFVVGRIVAAVAVGIMLPLMQVAIVNMYEAKERGVAMGLMGLVIGMAPAFGPTLTGLILNKDHTFLGITITNDWQSIFIIPLIFIVVATILAPFLIKDVLKNRPVKLDPFSLVTSTAGFGLFLWGFTNVSSEGWGDIAQVIAPISAGVIILIIFGWRQLKMPEPFLDIRVFMNPGFTIPTIALLLATMAMYGVEMMLPTYLQNVRGLSPLDSGLTLFWGALFMGLMSPLGGALYNKVGVKRLSFVGFVILLLGTLPFVYLTEQTPTIIITVLYALRMTAIALLMMPLTTAAMGALPDERAADATAANNTLRQVSSSVVVALMTSVVQNVINNNTPGDGMKKTAPLSYAKKVLDASLDGFQSAFIISLAFAIIGLIFVVFMKKEKEAK
ncbi:MFS transporter [Weissella paramesenteroides]|uniref:MFS transporter n=1 Tax=Weissella paramesenteroides TaxID=1249 RepID=UPI001C1FBB52|nr:MFS transporter [Weissella paramesenteroides]MBU7556640.1 MFS transporter [Weissella paramesenteroides]